MRMSLESPSFASGGDIPALYTCEGKDVSPPLQWSKVPSIARSLALIVDDPDAPDPKAPQRTWVHWVLFDIPVSATGLLEGATAATIGGGAREGLNDWKRVGYGGPCPPTGRHRYFFKLYALDVVLDRLVKPTKADVENAMHGHILARAELVGTYEKSGKRAHPPATHP